MLLQVILCFTATISFSVLFNCPRNQLVYCGLTGALGWIFYYFITSIYSNDAILRVFATAVVITLVSRVLSILRKLPITIFLIPGIFSLVPGAGIYETMYGIITEDAAGAAFKGIETLKIAGVIGIGIIVVLSLPPAMFRFLAKLRRSCGEG